MAPGGPAARRGDGRDAGRSLAPAWLDPILALAEAVDRRRRHIRPVRRGGVLGLELGRHHGAPVHLADGSIVPPGAPVGHVHLRNERVRELATHGWQLAGYREARADLAALTRWWERLPAAERPVAFTATTILAPFARREGWQVRPRPRTRRARLDEWWMSWLRVHFSRAGRGRRARSDRRLESAEVWLGARALAARFGSRAPRPH